MKRKPSNLTKLTKRSKNVMNSIIIGDVYDFSNAKNTVEQMFTYYSTVESGYIYDKQGNRYDVLCTSQQTDCGSFVGAGVDYKVKINYNDTIITAKSYLGIMSKNTGRKIISAFKEGIYLEDYLRLYLSDIGYEHRNLVKRILDNDYQAAAAETAEVPANPSEKSSVIDTIRADRQKPRQPGTKTEKANNRTTDER